MMFVNDVVFLIDTKQKSAVELERWRKTNSCPEGVKMCITKTKSIYVLDNYQQSNQ